MMKNPKVYIAGAGPGDPGLMTVKAQQLLGTVDLVLYDQLVSDMIIQQIPEFVEKVYVGKIGHAQKDHQASQHQIFEKIIF